MSSIYCFRQGDKITRTEPSEHEKPDRSYIGEQLMFRKIECGKIYLSLTGKERKKFGYSEVELDFDRCKNGWEYYPGSYRDMDDEIQKLKNELEEIRKEKKYIKRELERTERKICVTNEMQKICKNFTGELSKLIYKLNRMKGEM